MLPQSIADTYHIKKQHDDWSKLNRHWKQKDEVSFLAKHEIQKKMQHDYKLDLET